MLRSLGVNCSLGIYAYNTKTLNLILLDDKGICFGRIAIPYFERTGHINVYFFSVYNDFRRLLRYYSYLLSKVLTVIGSYDLW